jgi:hypothetical protein
MHKRSVTALLSPLCKALSVQIHSCKAKMKLLVKILQHVSGNSVFWKTQLWRKKPFCYKY